MDEPQNPSVSQGTESAQVVPQPPVAQPPAPMAPPAPVVPTIPTPPPQTPVVDLSGNKGMAIFAYLGPLILVPFLTEAKKDPFVKFHLKQGLVLIVAWIGVGILSSILSFMLYASGLFFIRFLFPIVYLGIFIINIIGLINASTGKEKELPVIGHLARNFNF